MNNSGLISCISEKPRQPSIQAGVFLSRFIVFLRLPTPENAPFSSKSEVYTLIVAFLSRILVFFGPAPGAKRRSGIFFSPFLQNFESRSGKKRNARKPVGFLTIFVVRERPQASSVRGLPRESQLCKAVGSRERKGYSDSKIFIRNRFCRDL